MFITGPIAKLNRVTFPLYINNIFNSQWTSYFTQNDELFYPLKKIEFVAFQINLVYFWCGSFLFLYIYFPFLFLSEYDKYEYFNTFRARGIHAWLLVVTHFHSSKQCLCFAMFGVSQESYFTQYSGDLHSLSSGSHIRYHSHILVIYLCILAFAFDLRQVVQMGLIENTIFSPRLRFHN